MLDAIVTALTTEISAAFTSIAPLVATVVGAVVSYGLLRRFVG